MAGIGLDLGEPAVFTLGGRSLMLYGGLRQSGEPRQIGLAYRDGAAWRRCPGTTHRRRQGPYRNNAIDPEPLIVGGRLYLFFGGGDHPSLGGNMNGRILVRVYDPADSAAASRRACFA